MSTEAERVTFIDLVSKSMSAAGFAPVDSAPEDVTPDAVVLMFYRPDTFFTELERDGTYGMVTVTVSGRELRMHGLEKMEKLARARCENAIRVYAAGRLN